MCEERHSLGAFQCLQAKLRICSLQESYFQNWQFQSVKGLQVNTFPTFPERQSGRGRFSDCLKVTTFTKIIQQANHHNLQLLRADSVGDPGQLLGLFCSSTGLSCSKNIGRWWEICLVKQITQKNTFQTLGPILIHFLALTEFSNGKLLVGLYLDFEPVVSRNFTFSNQKKYPTWGACRWWRPGQHSPPSRALTLTPTSSEANQNHHQPTALIHISFVINVSQFTLIR